MEDRILDKDLSVIVRIRSCGRYCVWEEIYQILDLSEFISGKALHEYIGFLVVSPNIEQFD